ncbi:MAG: DUF4494 domain-containing protein [Flavobacteriales bacterium]
MTNKFWFNCRVKWKKPDADGVENYTTEQYLLEAYTYTEAEMGINQVMRELGGGTFQLLAITKTNIVEVHESEENHMWFKVKLSMVAFDDESGKEKQSSFNMLLSAENVRDAYDRTKGIMKDSGTGYVIPSITYTKFEDVFHSADLNLAPEGFVPVSQAGEAFQA